MKEEVNEVLEIRSDIEGSDDEGSKVLSKCKYIDKEEPTKLSKPKLVIWTSEDGGDTGKTT